MLTKEAFNALLKTLEEPPPHAIFVLATTEPDRVPETVRSRCQRFDFRRIPTAEIVGHLEEILGSESGKAEPEALVAIARRATGSMRDAVSLLDQLLSYGDDTLTLARVERVLGLVNAQTIGKLVDCIAANDTAGGLALLNSLVAEGVELGQLVDQIVAYLRAVLFTRMARTPELLDLPQDVIQIVDPPGPGIHAGRVAGRGARIHRGARRAARSGARRAAVAHRAGLLPRGGCDERARSRRWPYRLPRLRPPGSRCARRRQLRSRVQARWCDLRPGRNGRRPPTSPPSEPWRPLRAEARPELPRCRTTTCVRPFRPTGSHSWAWRANAAAFRCRRRCVRSRRSRRPGTTIILRFSHTFSRDLVNRAGAPLAGRGVVGGAVEGPVQVRCALVGETVAAPRHRPSTAQPARPQNDDDAFLDDARNLGAVVT